MTSATTSRSDRPGRGHRERRSDGTLTTAIATAPAHSLDEPKPAWICQTCAVQYPDTAQPPAGCPICQGERQYVGWEGQQWTTMTDLGALVSLGE